MSEFPSSVFLKRVYLRITIIVFAPILFLLVFLLLTVVNPVIEAVILGAGIIIVAMFKYKHSMTVEVRYVVMTIKLSMFFMLLAGIPIWTLHLYEGDSEAVMAITTEVTAIMGMGYMLLGNAYKDMSSPIGLRGARLVSRGCYAYIFFSVLGVIAYFKMQKIGVPVYVWDTSAQDAVETYRTKVGFLLLIFLTSILGAFVSLCTVIFGSRFVVNSASLLEDAEARI